MECTNRSIDEAHAICHAILFDGRQEQTLWFHSTAVLISHSARTYRGKAPTVTTSSQYKHNHSTFSNDGADLSPDNLIKPGGSRHCNMECITHYNLLLVLTNEEHTLFNSLFHHGWSFSLLHSCYPTHRERERGLLGHTQ